MRGYGTIIRYHALTIRLVIGNVLWLQYLLMDCWVEQISTFLCFIKKNNVYNNISSLLEVTVK